VPAKLVLEEKPPSDQGADVRTVAKGGAVQITGAFALRGLNIVLVAISGRLLGQVGFGLYREVIQVFHIASHLAPGGFEYATVRFVARARAVHEYEFVRSILRIALTAALIVSGIEFIALMVGADYLGSVFGNSVETQRHIAFLLRVGAAFVPFWAVMQIMRFHTQAYKTMVPSVMTANVIQPAANVFLGVAALVIGFGVTGLVTSFAVSTGIAALAAVWYSRRMLTPTERRGEKRAKIGPILRFALPQGGTHLFNVQSLGLGVIIVGALNGPREVAIFAVALSLQGAGGVFLQGFVNIWAPVVTDLFERGEIARLQSLYQTINRWIATFSFPVFAMLILEPSFFAETLAGRAGVGAGAVVTLLAMGNLFYVGTGPSGHVLSMTGRPIVNFANSVVAVGLYVGLGILVVPQHGAVGMAVVDAAITALINIARVVEGKLLVGVQPFGRSYLKPVTATLAGAAVLFAWNAVGPGGTAGTPLVGIAVAGAVYALLLRLMGLDPEERLVLERIRARLLRFRVRPRSS
jgi:O-antigen/teichoic acid export membrane protein